MKESSPKGKEIQSLEKSQGNLNKSNDNKNNSIQDNQND
jgi:hypothetical protein